jgi:hypothetical protein
VLATIAIAAALMSDHQNDVCQITKWTARAKHQQLACHWLMKYSIRLIYLRRSVTMPVKNWLKAAVLQAGNDEAFAGILQNSKGSRKNMFHWSYEG